MPTARAQLRGGEVDIQSALRQIDTDYVTITYESDGTALGRLGRDVADAQPASSARKPSVGDERHLGADWHSLEHARQRQHLAHTRPATRTLATHHDHFTGADIVDTHGRDRRLFALEHPGRTAEGVVVMLDGADFDHRAAGSEVAEQHAERATRRMRLRDRPDTSLVEIPDALDIFADSLSSDRERVEEESVRLLRQLLEERGNAAGGVDILDMPLPVPVPRRRYFGKMRHTLGDIIKPRERIFDPRFVGDGDHVKQSVGRTAHCDIESYGVVDGVGGDDIAEADAALEKVKELVCCGAS